MFIVNIVYLFLFMSFCHSASLSGAHQNDSWAKKALLKMTLDEKIGQLFMIAGYVDADYAGKETGHPQMMQEIDDFIARYHVGGIAYVGPSTSAKQVALTNHYQQMSKYPLLIAQDLEWGLSMRIKDGMGFPKNITLGAIEDNQLIYEMGKEVGRQAKLIGVHMNLSPVLDVNTEPENISINVRSFGSSPRQVAEKGVAMIQGLQEAGIIASAKHFPGLGDISVDPHLGLPYSRHGMQRLREVELYPFVHAIKAGVLSIQTEHLVIPTLEPTPNVPSSLSPAVVNGLLKSELGFQGLVLSGAMRMKALTDHFSDEEIVLKAFEAGSDMLLMPQDLPKAYQTVKKALAEGKILEKDVDERVLKILQLKEKAGLDRGALVPIPSQQQLQTTSALALRKKLFQQAVTLVRDGPRLLPLSSLKEGRVAYVQLGEAPSADYYDLLNDKFRLDAFFFSLDRPCEQELERLLRQIDSYAVVLLAIFPADPRRIEQIRLLDPNKQGVELKRFRIHGIPDSFIAVASALECCHQKTIAAFFGNPFGLHFFAGYPTMIMAYEPDPHAQQAAAAIVMQEL